VRNLVAWGVFGASLGLAVIRAVGSRPPHDEALLPDALGEEVFLATTDREMDERREGAFRFPGSLWSQEDDFFAKETTFVKAYAADHRVSVGAILHALDRGIREKWQVHPGVVVTPKVVPCRPRLAYH
jgi:hypothetical protein